jgi:hypothetical protein
MKDIETIDSLDYLYSFSDSEIVNVILNPRDWTEIEIVLAKKIASERNISEIKKNSEIKSDDFENSGVLFRTLKFIYYLFCSLLFLAGIAFFTTGGIALIIVSLFLFLFPSRMSIYKLKFIEARKKKKSDWLMSLLKFIYHFICWLTLLLGIIGITQEEDKIIGISIICFSILLFIFPRIIKKIKKENSIQYRNHD